MNSFFENIIHVLVIFITKDLRTLVNMGDFHILCLDCKMNSKKDFILFSLALKSKQHKAKIKNERKKNI